ncbi:MAG TPA: hypothetical protein VJT74_07320 [Pyrinomonadaceae bacterium]|nr:hypothetical protein [Pyrinomonadaceae bacterium]
MKFYYRVGQALGDFVGRVLPPCDRVVPVISESMDRRLPPHKGLVLRLHLFICTRCSRYLRQLHLVRDALRAKSSALLNADSPETSFDAAARERVRRALDSRKN